MEQIQVHLKHVILPSNYSGKLKSISHRRMAARTEGFYSGAVERHLAFASRPHGVLISASNTCVVTRCQAVQWQDPTPQLQKAEE